MFNMNDKEQKHPGKQGDVGRNKHSTMTETNKQTNKKPS